MGVPRLAEQSKIILVLFLNFIRISYRYKLPSFSFLVPVEGVEVLLNAVSAYACFGGSQNCRYIKICLLKSQLCFQFFAQACFSDFFSRLHRDIIELEPEMQRALYWGGNHAHFGPLKCNCLSLVCLEPSSSAGLFSSVAAASLGSLRTLSLLTVRDLSYLRLFLAYHLSPTINPAKPITLH